MSSVSMVEERVITKAVTMPIQASVLHGPRDIRLVRLSFLFCSVVLIFIGRKSCREG
jgi:hypothetical protein